MSCREKIRERRTVKLDSWDAYIRAIDAQLEFEGSSLDRVQACKRRLRDRLERLESEATQSESLANRARAGLLRASKSLRVELSAPRPADAKSHAIRRQAIGLAIARADSDFNTIAASLAHNGSARLRQALEDAMRAMVTLEAELEVAEWALRDHHGVHSGRFAGGREFHDQLRSLSAAVAAARKLSDANAEAVEAEIASGIGWLRELLASH